MSAFVAYASDQIVPPEKSWSVVLDLIEIFRPLAGILTATYNKKLGFVEVALIEGEPGPKYHLFCTEPTGKYAKGQIVTDPADVDILSEDTAHFVRIAAQR